MEQRSHNSIDRTNEVYGNLIVLGDRERRGKNTYWLCECSCGAQKYINSGSLTSGRTTSCGCKRGLAPNQYKPKHLRGLTALKNMKTRCYNSNNADYVYYGARGILICDEWLTNSFSFYKWFDEHYVEGLKIDRIDNNAGYSPDNCKFSTQSEQSINRRPWCKSND